MAAVIVLMAAHGARTQEVLRSARAVDQRAKPRPAPADEVQPMKVGPVELNVGLTYTIEYNDNVVTSEKPEGDFIQRPGADLKAELPVSSNGRLNLGFGVGYINYFSSKNRHLDRFYIDPDSAIDYKFSAEDFDFNIYDQLEYSQDVGNVGALAGVAQFPRFENTAGIRVTYAPNAWSYLIGYSHFNFLSVGNATNSTNGSFSYLDRSSEQFHLRGTYRFAPKTEVGVDATVGLTDYDDELQQDNITSSLGPYTEWHVTEAIAISAKIGFTSISLQEIPEIQGVRLKQPGHTLASYYGNLGVTHSLTEFIEHDVSVSHEIRPGVNRGRDYLESTTAGYGVRWTATSRINVNGGLTFEHGVETSVDGPTVQSLGYDHWRISLGATYRVSKRLRVNVAQTFIRRIGDRDYSQNRTLLGARLQF